MRTRTHRWLLASAVMALAAPARAENAFHPTRDLDLSSLQRIVSDRALAVQADVVTARVARTEIRQARLWANPVLDASWSTIPIGETNPPGLSAPLANVPNYTVGLSYGFIIGKRGPATERAEALADAATFASRGTARRVALELAHVIGTLGTASLRIEGLSQQIVDQKQALEIAKSRLGSGFGTPLDVDRLEIEVSRVEQQLTATEADVSAGLAACSRLVRVHCSPFASSNEARAFLTAWVERALSGTVHPHVEQLPEVRALDSAIRAADAERDLARARVIPDPSVRLAYTRDQFLIAGNQRDSLSVGVAFPIPIFDHGQALAAQAEVKRNGYAAQRERLVSTNPERAKALREIAEAQLRRREAIRTSILPRARAVVDSLQHAAAQRLLPLTDVIQARRTLAELLLQEADSYGDAFEASVSLLSEVMSDAEVR